MWYKRYGYKQPKRIAVKGIGCISILCISLISFFISFCVAVPMQNAWLLIATIPLSIVGFEVFDRYASNKFLRLRKKRHKMHLERAYSSIELNSAADALEAIRRAKIYNDIPDDLKEYESKQRDV